MAKQPNQLTVKLLEILDDGLWHDHSEVLAELSALVPSDEAWKKGEWYREYHYKRSGRPVGERRYGSDTNTIATGQRVIAGKVIENLRRRAQVEVEYGESKPEAKRRRISRIRKI